MIELLDTLNMAMVSLRMVVVVQDSRRLLASQYERQPVTNTLRLSRIWLDLPYDHLAEITLFVGRLLSKYFRRRHRLLPLYMVLSTT